jgi:hypothetical protein
LPIGAATSGESLQEQIASIDNSMDLVIRYDKIEVTYVKVVFVIT